MDHTFYNDDEKQLDSSEKMVRRKRFHRTEYQRRKRYQQKVRRRR